MICQHASVLDFARDRPLLQSSTPSTPLATTSASPTRATAPPTTASPAPPSTLLLADAAVPPAAGPDAEPCMAHTAAAPLYPQPQESTAQLAAFGCPSGRLCNHGSLSARRALPQLAPAPLRNALLAMAPVAPTQPASMKAKRPRTTKKKQPVTNNGARAPVSAVKKSPLTPTYTTARLAPIASLPRKTNLDKCFQRNSFLTKKQRESAQEMYEKLLTHCTELAGPLRKSTRKRKPSARLLLTPSPTPLPAPQPTFIEPYIHELLFDSPPPVESAGMALCVLPARAYPGASPSSCGSSVDDYSDDLGARIKDMAAKIMQYSSTSTIKGLQADKVKWLCRHAVLERAKLQLNVAEMYPDLAALCCEPIEGIVDQDDWEQLGGPREKYRSFETLEEYEVDKILAEL